MNMYPEWIHATTLEELRTHGGLYGIKKLTQSEPEQYLFTDTSIKTGINCVECTGTFHGTDGVSFWIVFGVDSLGKLTIKDFWQIPEYA